MRELIKLASTGKNAKGKDTGTIYTTKIDKKSQTGKLEIKKYDPKAIHPKTGKPGSHVIFKQSKI